MIIIEVFRQGFPEVPGAQNHKVVQTLPANGTDEALSVWVLPRALRRSEHFFHAQCGDLGTDFDSVNAIPVADKESGWSRSAKASIICCAVQAAVGCSVTAKCSTWRRRYSNTKNTNSTFMLIVGTVKKSIETIWPIWL